MITVRMRKLMVWLLLHVPAVSRPSPHEGSLLAVG